MTSEVLERSLYPSGPEDHCTQARGWLPPNLHYSDPYKDHGAIGSPQLLVSSLLQPAANAYASVLWPVCFLAFRPTGSTEAAIITLLHTVTNLLLSNPYVIVISLDFSKAFDIVRHYTLLQKAAELDLPDHVFNWLVDFFEGHSHRTVYAGDTSSMKKINASIIQGSSIGPASYIITSSHLATIHPDNSMIKYADDTYLIIPASGVNTRAAEISIM